MFGQPDHRPPPWQDTMMVCEAGHQITDQVRKTSRQLPKRCPDCGSPTITACPECNHPIPGTMYYPNVISMGSDAVPDHCAECGKPYPWTKAKPRTEKAQPMTQQSNRVFIVHGHDEAMKMAAARTLEKLGLEAIILHEQASEGKTIIEKFEKWADVGFAVVLMSPDDLAFPKTADVKKDKPTHRARQNVIFELGYFLGKLGRHRVMVLQKDGVESLSDYSGVIYERFDNASGLWQFTLVKELQAQGYDNVSADMLTRGDVKKKTSD